MHTERRSPCVLKWRVTCRRPVIVDVITPSTRALDLMQFRLSTLLIVTLALTIAFAAFSYPHQHPPEVCRILATLPNVPSDADLETTVEMLVIPVRPASSVERLQPDDSPRYCVDIGRDYRLVLEFKSDIIDTADKTLSGPLVFDGARVERYNEAERNWQLIYPYRTKTETIRGHRRDNNTLHTERLYCTRCAIRRNVVLLF